ncbi:MAG: tRNA (cytidine(34)-2'-O)-methyltransferase [Sphaerochaetaceae bacterium]|nr:tRNA (cytidine(34)-2'-O)-methyltransferase [Sphaerochaetaceae bacterium]
MKLNIVLFEPEIPQNTGNIARTCAALGARLHLVHPLGFSLEEKYVRHAGLDYWDKLELVEHDSVKVFLDAHGSCNLVFFTTKARACYCDLDYRLEGELYLVFGKESAGIDEEVLVRYPQSCVRLPMKPSIRSLNLSNSVAIAAYEAFRQNGFEGLEEKGDLHRLRWNDNE